MIRSFKVLFCDNEHGSGDVTFPDIRYDIEPLQIINAPTTATLRKQAKNAGWIRHNGADYCDMCAESITEGSTSPAQRSWITRRAKAGKS